jgi:hypothetical protein
MSLPDTDGDDLPMSTSGAITLGEIAGKLGNAGSRLFSARGAVDQVG